MSHPLFFSFSILLKNFDSATFYTEKTSFSNFFLDDISQNSESLSQKTHWSQPK
jgi:hypothetical protein